MHTYNLLALYNATCMADRLVSWLTIWYWITKSCAFSWALSIPRLPAVLDRQTDAQTHRQTHNSQRNFSFNA